MSDNASYMRLALGEARDRILDAYGAVVQVVEVASLEDAVRVAYGLASPGGTVLLAPACASLDMFKDYAERGRLFKQAVGRLQEDARTRVTTS